MHFQVYIVPLILLSACASAPGSPSTIRSSTFALPPAAHARIQFVSARTDSRPSSIGRADLEQARALLFQVRNDLEPRQWEALAGKLSAAERAFERFSQATKASGQSTQVVRAVESISQVDRVKTWIRNSSRVVPMLVCLLLLYPANTAGPEIDHRPEWLEAQREYEARLRDVAEESRRLMENFAPRDAKEVVPNFNADPIAAVTAPTPWWKKPNPATGKPYTSAEEYDRVPRHAGQTCKNSRLDELQSEKDLLNRAVPPLDPKSPGSWNEKKMAKVPCSQIRQRLEAQKKLREKRWQVQKECFGGRPDPSHENAMTEVENALANTKRLEDQNCTPGHPMAEQ